MLDLVIDLDVLALVLPLRELLLVELLLQLGLHQGHLLLLRPPLVNLLLRSAGRPTQHYSDVTKIIITPIHPPSL